MYEPENLGRYTMWFEPNNALSKRTTSSAIPANPAISNCENRKVAKIAAPFNSEAYIDKLESSVHQPKDLTNLANIGEKDQDIIDETLAGCKNGKKNPRYFLSQTIKTKVIQQSESQSISCRTCEHFNCFNNHGGGAGHCIIETQLTGYSRWSDTRHQCNSYSTPKSSKPFSLVD